MAEYREIQGAAVQSLASNTGTIEGQIWYDTANNLFKLQSYQAAGVWSTGGVLGTARYFAQNGAGTQNAALVFGGQAPVKYNTESYDGTAWTEVNDMSRAPADTTGMGAGGTQTSALAAGTQPVSTLSESWNGTSWTSTPALNSGRGYLAGSIESNTAGIVYGGLGPTTGVALTELYNGSTWSEVADLNTARRSNAGVGSSTAALGMGGYSGGNVANCESWDGSCWTTVNSQPIAGGGAAFGTLALAVKKQGVNTELWDGTNWSTGTSSSDNISNRSGLGTSSLGLLAGGEPPPGGTTTVEEYSGPGPVTQTITTS